MANRRTERSLLPFTYIAKAVADENRIRILAALRDHELCVCQIVELLGLAPSTVSKHLSILRQAYLVDARKDGRWTYYSRPAVETNGAVKSALEWIDESLAAHSAIREDARKLGEIVKMPLEKLCKLPHAD